MGESTVAESAPTRKPRVRVDVSKAADFLQAATFLVEPDDAGQREAFNDLFPHLYVLRKRGCTYAQLTALLSKVGFSLQPSTFRNYFNEELAKKSEKFKKQMDEQVITIDAIRREAEGESHSDTAIRLNAMFAQRRKKTTQPTVDQSDREDEV